MPGHLESARSALHFADTARRVALSPEANLVLPPLLQIRQLRADNSALKAQLVPSLLVALQAHTSGRL